MRICNGDTRCGLYLKGWEGSQRNERGLRSAGGYIYMYIYYICIFSNVQREFEVKASYDWDIELMIELWLIDWHAIELSETVGKYGFGFKTLYAHFTERWNSGQLTAATLIFLYIIKNNFTTSIVLVEIKIYNIFDIQTKIKLLLRVYHAEFSKLLRNISFVYHDKFVWKA